MKLFNKKEEKKTCCCGGDYTLEAISNAEQAKKENGIMILGSGCAKCIALEKATGIAAAELGLHYDILHSTDFTQIASYGVMSTPALILNGKIVSYGKALTVEEVKKILDMKE